MKLHVRHPLRLSVITILFLASGPALIARLVADQDWRVTAGTADALVSIGGHEFEAELVKLLKHDDKNRVRRHATEALFALLGNDSGVLA